MNITSYNTKTSFLMPSGNMVLKKDYFVASADEYMYTFLDVHVNDPFLDLVHPEDQSYFKEAFSRAEAAPEFILARVLTMENEYRYMLLRICASKAVVDGFSCVEVSVADVIAQMDRYKVNRVNLIKYRRLLCMSDSFYFDYSKKTNKINIFMYSNDKSYLFTSMDLDEWKEEMLSEYVEKQEDKVKFESIYRCIRDGLSNFKIPFATHYFSKAARADDCLFSGSVFYDEDGSRMVTGTIETDSNFVEQPYYTTEASRDSATGLMNKRAIMEYAAYTLQNEAVKTLALFVIDIDDFKRINDTYGHLSGDQVIFSVAETIKRIVGSRGVVSRFGGDEFVILLEKTEGRGLENLLRTIYGDVSMLFVGENEHLKVTISTGIALYPKDGETYEELFQKADKALYIAKANGKSQYQLYDEEKHARVEYENPRGRMKGLKSISSRVNRSMMYSEILLTLSKGGTEAIADVMDKVCELFDVDGISIYAGEELRCVKRLGNYREEFEQFPFREFGDFMQMIKADDALVIDDISRLKESSFYEVYQRCEVHSNLLSFYRVEGKIKALVSFDIFNTSRNWSETDIFSLNAIGKLMGLKVSGD